MCQCNTFPRSKVLRSTAGCLKKNFRLILKSPYFLDEYRHCTVRLQKACALFCSSSRSFLHNQGRHLVSRPFLGNCAAAQSVVLFYNIAVQRTMAGVTSLDAVKRKIKSLQEQADGAEERAERLQKELLAHRKTREQVSTFTALRASPASAKLLYSPSTSLCSFSCALVLSSCGGDSLN